MRSTPGYCMLSHLGTTNGQIFKWDGLRMDPERVNLVRDHVKLRFDALKRGQPICDDLKVFVKQEPHKIKKLEEGRIRLISAVSLVDSLIDRILFAWMLRRQLDTVGQTPCLVGWSPIRGGWRKIQAIYANSPVNCLDKRAWDWTVKPYLVDMWIEFLTQLPVNPPEWWVEMVKLRMALLFDAPWFRFEDGTRVQQGVRGIMKSGCFLTILLNSLSQSMLHYVANKRCGKDPLYKQPQTMGDDTVQGAIEYLDEYVEKFKELGVNIKEAKVQHWVEFSGFCFDGQTCYPAYWQKHLFNIAHSPRLEEALPSYQILYVNEPVMYKFITRLSREIGPQSSITKLEALDVMNSPL